MLGTNFNPFKNPQINAISAIPKGVGIEPKEMMKTSFVDSPSSANGPSKSFLQTMDHMVQGADESMKAPDKLLERYFTTGDVDVHDLMIANTKADITINIASQVATKIIQAYDRIQQIQL